MLLGAHLTLMMGPILAIPVPLPLAEALVGVEVTSSDRGRSGFQLQFQVGRSGPLDLRDYPLVTHPLLRPFTRVVVMVRFNLLPRVLMDGVITQITLTPSEDPGASTLTVTGEDVSVMMDLEQLRMPWPGMTENAIATAIIAKYAPYGLVPAVMPPFMIDAPVPTRRIPQQTGTDLEHLNALAERYSYVFYVEPTSVPMVNRAYWGPPVRVGMPEKALSVNMGPGSNVSSMSFSYNALSPAMVADLHQDTDTNVTMPVGAPPMPVQPPLALVPAAAANGGKVRTTVLTRTQESVEALMQGPNGQPGMSRHDAELAVGLSAMQAQVRAVAGVQASLERTATASGELDALQYGDILRARSIVGVRGAGFTHDGNWYVQSVTHSIKKGEYKQRFTLNREGTGSLLPLVRP
ncbi:MAG: hypothetical protein KY467_12180 [Gemmatimonadetes bacterium]|nr:hypothetical protein [Gemmatimonadota bacterium]